MRRLGEHMIAMCQTTLSKNLFGTDRNALLALMLGAAIGCNLDQAGPLSQSTSELGAGAITPEDYWCAPSLAANGVPHGAKVGALHNVTIYSNGHPDCVSPQYAVSDDFETGIAWQCVEFVVRYYFEHFGVKIRGGDAKDWWGLAGGKGLEREENGKSSSPPQEGAILVSEVGLGHVAIVGKVQDDSIVVYQQNWYNNSKDNGGMRLALHAELDEKGNTVYRVADFSAKYKITGWLALPSTVQPPTPTISLIASPSIIAPGEAATLSWSSSGTSGCTGSWTRGSLGASGTQQVKPLSTARYSIDCSSAAGVLSASAVVTVEARSASSATISVYSNRTSSWALEPGNLTGRGLTSHHTVAAAPCGTTYTLSATQLGGYRVEVSNSDGVGDAVTVRPGETKIFSLSYAKVDKPIVAVTLSPPTITAGQTASLTWTSTGATSCDASWLNNVEPNGSMVVAANTNTTYSLTCRNVAGSTTARAHLTVKATAPTTATISVTSNRSSSWSILPVNHSDSGTRSTHTVSPASTGSVYTIVAAPIPGYSVGVTSSGGSGPALMLLPGQSARFDIRYTVVPTPRIHDVTPDPVPGLDKNQPLTVSGKDFPSGANVRLRDLTNGGVWDKVPVIATTSQLVINANFTRFAATWSAEVINPNGPSSGEFRFRVQAAPPPSAAPMITSVTPNPVIGFDGKQAFTIQGQHFATGANIILRDLTTGELFDWRTPIVLTATYIGISVNFTTAKHDWSVEVVNPSGSSSGQFRFKVK